MASATQNLTTYYAKRIIGDPNATDWSTALLQTGTGVKTSTWIFAQTARAGSKCGIRYAFHTDASNNNIRDVYEIYGGVYDSATGLYPPIASIECGTGNTYIRGDTHIQGNVHIGTLPNNNNNNNYRLFVDGSVNFDFTNVNNGEFIVGTSTAYLSINGSTILAYPASTSNNTTVQSTLYLNCTSGDNPPLGEVYIGGKTTHYGQIYRAYTASNQSAMIRMNGSNYDNYLWKIDDDTDSYGYGLKYKGTGSGAANYLQLMADNQGQTQVTAVCIDQSGNIGLGTDTTSSSYKLYVDGNNYFDGTVTSNGSLTVNDSSYFNASAYIQYNTPNLYIKDTNTDADTYAIIRFGNSSTNDGAYIFLNGPSRTADGGPNMLTIRNNVGNLRLDDYVTITDRLVINYKSGTWVNSLTNSAIIIPDQTGSYGGWICGPTKNGRIAISTYQSNDDILYIGYGESGRTTNSFTRSMTWNGANGKLTAGSVANAIWNDYAECRVAEIIEPGYCITESETGKMIKTSQRLMPGCKLISDTYGVIMGETPLAQTPIAVAGRVLAYTYQDRNNYPLGAAVCSAPNGTIDIMTREEIINYPERIVGTVSEIPTYDVWYAGENGEKEIQVNNRIWIYVK